MEWGRNPWWPQALDAVQSHFKSWWEAGARKPGWTALADDLGRLGLDKNARDGLLGWAEALAAQRGKTTLRLRLLHPMEREMLTVGGYGRLLELYRIGLLDAAGVEQILDQCAALTQLPATVEQIQVLTQRLLSESIAAQGFGLPH